MYDILLLHYDLNVVKMKSAMAESSAVTHYHQQMFTNIYSTGSFFANYRFSSKCNHTEICKFLTDIVHREVHYTKPLILYVMCYMYASTSLVEFFLLLVNLSIFNGTIARKNCIMPSTNFLLKFSRKRRPLYFLKTPPTGSGGWFMWAYRWLWIRDFIELLKRQN